MTPDSRMERPFSVLAFLVILITLYLVLIRPPQRKYSGYSRYGRFSVTDRVP